MPYSPGPALTWNGGAAIAHTGTADETTKISKLVPGGLMGINGRIEYDLYYSWPDTANDKTVKVKLGGTTFVTRLTTGTQTTGRINGFIANRGEEDSQVGCHLQATGGFGESATAVVTASVDTEEDAFFTVTCQLETDSETLTIQAYSIKVYRSD